MQIELGDRWAIKYNLKRRSQPWQVIDKEKVRVVKTGARAGDVASHGVVASLPTLPEAAAALGRHAEFTGVQGGADPLAAVHSACDRQACLLSALAEIGQRFDWQRVARQFETAREKAEQQAKWRSPADKPRTDGPTAEQPSPLDSGAGSATPQPQRRLRAGRVDLALFGLVGEREG